MLLAIASVSASLNAPRYTVELTPQVYIDQNRLASKPSAILNHLPQSQPGGAEIMFDDKSTKLFAPKVGGVEIAGFGVGRQPFLSVFAVARSSANHGAIPLVPGKQGYTVPQGMPTGDIVRLQDVNTKGRIAITVASNSGNLKNIPSAWVFGDGKWEPVGQADDLKINNKGDIAGITRVSEGEAQRFVAFKRIGGKNQILARATHILLGESGEILSYIANTEPLAKNRIQHLAENLMLTSKAGTKPFPLKPGFVPLAMWSANRLIVHRREASDEFFLVEDGKYLPISRFAKLQPGFTFRDVKRVYPDGSIWVLLSDNEGMSYDAFLKPVK